MREKKCLDCEAIIPKTRKRCAEHARQAQRRSEAAYKKKHPEARRRKMRKRYARITAGVPHVRKVKQVASCPGCGCAFERTGYARKFCAPCKASRRKEAKRREVQKNRQRYAVHNEKRRLREGDTDVTRAQREAIFADYSHTCAYCGASATSLDHVVPLARGGAHAVENLVPACMRCNKSKNDSPLLVWLARRPMKGWKVALNP